MFLAISTFELPSGIFYVLAHSADSSSLQKTKSACLRAAVIFANSNWRRKTADKLNPNGISLVVAYWATVINDSALLVMKKPVE